MRKGQIVLRLLTTVAETIAKCTGTKGRCLLTVLYPAKLFQGRGKEVAGAQKGLPSCSGEE
jgi:hypothetical protein